MKMTRKEMIYSIKGSTSRGDTRINAELDELFGEDRDEFSTDDFQEYMRVYVFHTYRRMYASHWSRDHASTVPARGLSGNKITKPGAPVI